MKSENVYQLESMCHDPNELNHLQSGHVLLPPDVLLQVQSHTHKELNEYSRLFSNFFFAPATILNCLNQEYLIGSAQL